MPRGAHASGKGASSPLAIDGVTGVMVGPMILLVLVPRIGLLLLAFPIYTLARNQVGWRCPGF